MSVKLAELLGAVCFNTSSLMSQLSCWVCVQHRKNCFMTKFLNVLFNTTPVETPSGKTGLCSMWPDVKPAYNVYKNEPHNCSLEFTLVFMCHFPHFFKINFMLKFFLTLMNHPLQLLKLHLILLKNNKDLNNRMET